ncbi:uncharacterized protein LOC128956959 [Oppia nitens]|uniref:uncharacterized protein LOC128956959 n=1 Tax=Oppia nitens TaxID=1686743 RepID=UPI0023DBD972|nr:uncharacterized protein LOC128956959 [Oppia nitens]
MDCSDFTDTYIKKSSDNALAFFKAKGHSDKMAAEIMAYKLRLIISKSGNEWTLSRINSNGKQHTLKFELDKEFDEILPNGHIAKSIVSAGNGCKQFIHKQLDGELEIKFIYDFNNSEPVVTGIIGGVTAKWFFAKD